jgi:DNA-directed RNA polymerase specialized sigma24 family protein
MKDKRIPQLREKQDQALLEAKNAAASCDPRGMVEALYRSFVLDGLIRLLRNKWPSLYDEVEFILAEAVDVLYQAISRGEKILNIPGFLYKVCDRKAYDHARHAEESFDPDNPKHAAPSSSSPTEQPILQEEEGHDGHSEELDREEKRHRAVAIARKLIPRLGQQSVQSVMTYVIDAVEAGREDLPDREVADALGLSLDTVRQSKSRGFRRLARIAHEERLAVRDIALAGLERDGDEEPSDELGQN